MAKHTPRERQFKSLRRERRKQKYNEERKAYIRYIRDWIIELKHGLKCQACPESDDNCLEFHHINPTGKEFSIGKATEHHVNLKTLKDEIRKCACVCSNCHKKIHAGKINPILEPIKLALD